MNEEMKATERIELAKEIIQNLEGKKLNMSDQCQILSLALQALLPGYVIEIKGIGICL